jgi:hypothetical protein
MIHSRDAARPPLSVIAQLGVAAVLWFGLSLDVADDQGLPS